MVVMNIVNLYDNYNNYFNDDLKNVFKKFSKSAAKYGYRIYLVGGIVRDLLLGLDNLDVDITVEGDAIAFARILEKENMAKVISVHEDFGTVKVESVEKIGLKIDLASTRSEIYEKAGHLPTVVEIGCELEKDVIRRDFTVNSLAMSLNEDSFADLVDYVGGYEDLKSKKLRILHNKSFIDDPTRIIRGLKYSIRLGFDLGEGTFRLQEEYLENINYDMCYSRVKRELRLTLGLDSDECFRRFVGQKIYKLVTKKEISFEAGIENLTAKYAPKASWLVYLGVVLMAEDFDSLVEKTDELEFTKREKNIILNAKRLSDVKISQDDFAIYKAFDGLDIESLLIFAMCCGAEKVLRFLDVLSGVKISVSGKDLLELGIEPSGKFKDALDYVLKKKLENPQLDEACEKKLLADYVKGL